ncbi:acyl carrier protein [Streptomyces sp. NPDC052415]|uniref:acyl carrier protein n=1 Tax=Streptomyces sp. NPDC052415 TaxID=3365690 RepID=UPI0037CEE95F
MASTRFGEAAFQQVVGIMEGHVRPPEVPVGYPKRWVFMGSQVAEKFTEDRLKGLLQSYFQIDPAKLEGSVRFSDLELDSIAVMELVVVIEEQTGIDVQESLLEQMTLDTTLAQAVEAVDQTLSTSGAAAKNDA